MRHVLQDKENDGLIADKKGLEGQALTMKRRSTEMEGALRELQGQLQNVTRHSNYLEEHVRFCLGSAG